MSTTDEVDTGKEDISDSSKAAPVTREAGDWDLSIIDSGEGVEVGFFPKDKELNSLVTILSPDNFGDIVKDKERLVGALSTMVELGVKPDTLIENFDDVANERLRDESLKSKSFLQEVESRKKED